jgi:hypothetical protein
LVLAPWCGRIQVGHLNVVRKKSFIVGKGKQITCFTCREGFPASQRSKGNIVYFMLVLYHLKLRGGRDYV